MVGGGVIGLSTALRLAQLGAKVTLYEADQLGSGATGATFAWLNSSDKHPESYHRLNVNGMAEYTRMQHELGGAPWLHLGGHVEWRASSNGPASLFAKARRLRSWGYPVQLLTRRDLEVLCAELRPPAAIESVLYSPTEGYVDTVGLTADLAARARAAGVRIRTNVRVADFEVADGSVRTLVTATGEKARVSAAVLCPGADVGPLAATLGLEVPMQHAPGLLVYTSPAPIDCGLTITSQAVNIRPDRHGRFCLQAVDLDDRASSTSDVHAIAEEILSRARRILPGLRHARVGEWRFGRRPIPADGLPVVGRIPTLTNAYMAVSHSGITLGPLLGRLIAAEVCVGRLDPRLADFSPGRLRHEVAPRTPG